MNDRGIVKDFPRFLFIYQEKRTQTKGNRRITELKMKKEQGMLKVKGTELLESSDD